MQETSRTEAKRTSSEHSVIWQLSCWEEKAELLFLNVDCLTVVITTYWSYKILNIHGLSLEIPPSIGKLVYISDFQLQLQISSY